MTESDPAGKKTSVFLAETPQSAPNPKTGKQGTAQFLMVLFLLACCLFSAYLYRRNALIPEEGRVYHANALPDAGAGISKEPEEIRDALESLANVSEANARAMQSAMLAEISGRYPVAAATALFADFSGGGASAEASRTAISAVEPEPPRVAVLAVMIAGGEEIAMLDVLGGESGLVVRKGSKFVGGAAWVTKIDAKGVTFTWRKKSYRVTISQ